MPPNSSSLQNVFWMPIWGDLRGTREPNGVSTRSPGCWKPEGGLNCSELCIVISYWRGCICGNCWGHDWRISSCSASAPLIILLNVTTGEALWKAAVTLPPQWCTLAPHSTFLSDISTFEWTTSEAFQCEHASGVSGWPGAELRILVNGLQDPAYWGTWTQWPKKSETKMSLTGPCRSEVDKSRHGSVRGIWFLSWKGNTDPRGGQRHWFAGNSEAGSERRHLPESQVVCGVILRPFSPSTCLCGDFLFGST